MPMARQQPACLQQATGRPLSCIPGTGHPAPCTEASSSFLPLLFKAPKLLTEDSELMSRVFSTLFPSEGGTEQGKEKTSQGALRGMRNT